jgi:pilus assembly protein CpaF
MRWLTKNKRKDPTPWPLEFNGQQENGDTQELPAPVVHDAPLPMEEVATPSYEEAQQDEREQQFQRIKSDVHRQVIGKIELSLIGTMNEGDLRFEIRRASEKILEERSYLLNSEDRERLVNEVIDETFGLGPLEPLFHDPTITDILINGAKTVYVERRGRLEKTRISFANDRHLTKIIQRIVSAVGRRVDETTPMVDARLEDGSRVNAIIPPLALDGPLVSIRRFGARPLKDQDLLDNHSITPDMLKFLQCCVRARLNVLISGGTGSGKTTLLNVLSAYIPREERVATIEDAAELQLQQPHVIRMETRPANVEGEGQVSTRDLVRNSLRMRPDRIIVGECRGPEALDMLQAMNTGHDGSLTTIHANSCRDALMRLEMMVGMAGFDVPIWTIRRQIASAINVVVQAVRLTGGPRKIVRISEITGMEGDMITMHDLFIFKQTGVNEHRVAEGYFAASGVRPNCMEQLASAGEAVPNEMFEQRILKFAE